MRPTSLSPGALPLLAAVMAAAALARPQAAFAGLIKLPPPSLKGAASLEEALAGRRTIREFTGGALTGAQVSQLLWAADGVTETGSGKRSAPSAGALYPLEIYLALGVPAPPVAKPGIYRYLPREHALEVVRDGVDAREPVGRAALGQMWLAGAPAVLLIAADYGRVCRKYGDRGYRYAHVEAGCAAQNLLLQARALGLASAVVGAFRDDEVAKAFSLPSSQAPLLLIPVGK